MKNLGLDDGMNTAMSTSPLDNIHPVVLQDIEKCLNQILNEYNDAFVLDQNNNSISTAKDDSSLVIIEEEELLQVTEERLETPIQVEPETVAPDTEEEEETVVSPLKKEEAPPLIPISRMLIAKEDEEEEEQEPQIPISRDYSRFEQYPTLEPCEHFETDVRKEGLCLCGHPELNHTFGSNRQLVREESMRGSNRSEEMDQKRKITKLPPGAKKLIMPPLPNQAPAAEVKPALPNHPGRRRSSAPLPEFKVTHLEHPNLIRPIIPSGRRRKPTQKVQEENDEDLI